MKPLVSRLHFIAFLLPLFPCACSVAQSDSAPALASEWAKYKNEYLADIGKSQDAVLQQFEKSETYFRSSGKVAELKSLQGQREAFAGEGKIHSSINRQEFDRIRQEAVQKFSDNKDKVDVKALQSREDAIAEVIEEEFKELSIPIVADAHARWVSALARYKSEVIDAKTIITKELDLIEAKARMSADPDSVNDAKEAKDFFNKTGVIPPGISNDRYDTSLAAAKELLSKENKSIVRMLLINKHDVHAEAISKQLEFPVASEGNPASPKGNDARTAWENVSYNTVFHHRRGNDWDEINSKGKLERKVRETGRTKDFIEILLLDRQHQMRLYEDHADMFKDGRWQWVANGSWVDGD